MEAYAKMKADFLALKKEYNSALILFRCGDFYRSISDDAHVIARIMERPEDDIYEIDGIDAISFRFNRLEVYLPKLVKAGHRVVIADSDVTE